MSAKDVEYQRRAEEAKRWADKVSSPVEKAAWLRIAQGWLRLLKREPPNEQDRSRE